MPRKARAEKRRAAQYSDTTMHFLRTGRIAVQGADSPWIGFALRFPAAQDLRAAWLAGDETGIAAAAAALPGRWL